MCVGTGVGLLVVGSGAQWPQGWSQPAKGRDQGPGLTGTRAGSLVGEARSQGLWLQDSGGPEAGISLLVIGAKA